MHKPESVLLDKIQTDHLIVTRGPDLVLINKKKRICNEMDFAIPAD